MNFIKRNIPIFLTGAVLLVIFIVIIALSQTKTAKTPELVTVKDINYIAPHTYLLGFPEAPFSVVMFSNYSSSQEKECLTVLLDLYRENRNYLNAAVRPYSTKDTDILKAKATQLAGDQNKFWEYLEEVFDINGTQEEASALASKLGLEVKAFNQKLNGDEISAIISADLADAKRLRVTATPTIFVNEEKVEVSSPEELRQKIQEMIDRLKAGNPADSSKTADSSEAESKKKELTPDQKKRVETIQEIYYTDSGWSPADIPIFKGQTVRWTNNTEEPIILVPLDKNYEDLRSPREILPGESLEFKFPSGGLFRYEERKSFNWGMLTIEW